MAHHTSSGRGLLCSASLLASALLASACGPDKPVTPPPPLVSITVPDANIIGKLVKLSVTVSGCDQVQTLTLFNQGEQVRSLPPNTGETQVEVQKNELRYSRGIAAPLSFTARAVCTDGRQSDSQPVAATFFPVESVVESVNNSVQVVPDYFIAEGGTPGLAVSFLGCGNLDTGIGMLYRVDGNGEVRETDKLQLPFVCNATTTITERHSSGIRWVWTADAGVIAINDDFEIVSRPSPQLRLNMLVMDPDGNAIAQNTSGEILRLKSRGGLGNIVQWTYSTSDKLIGTPVFRRELGRVLLPYFASNVNGPQDAVRIHALDYTTTRTGDVDYVDRAVVKYLYNTDDVLPAAAISSNGNDLYLAFWAAGGQTLVLSCPTNGLECEGNNIRWQSQALPGRVALMMPYAGGNRLAAVAPQQVWFLDPNSQGAITNKGGTPLASSGGLNILQVQQGASTNSATSGHDFYLFNGPSGSLQTVEIVGMDRAENGHLFRYQMPANNLTGAVDGAGALWLRIHRKLVKLLPLSDYRNAIPK
ncbi:hypothetical protein P2318_13020 [Myxococcaceae bacterium GXIMD 01537]